MKNPRGAWRMLVGAVLLQFAVVGLVINAFSVYLPYLLKQCGLSNTQNASVVMIRTGAALVTLLFVGKIYEKLELRKGITLSVVLAVISLWIYAGAKSFWQLGAAAIVSGMAYGMGGMYAVSLLIHRWFRVHEALALGICTATTGLATVIGAPVATALVEFGSVPSALRIESAFIALCALGCCLLIRNYPADQPVQPIQKQRRQIHFRFRSMHIAAAFIGLAGNTSFQFLALHFTTQGFAAFQVSALVSVAGLSLMASKFLFGEAVDHWGAYRSNWLFFGSCAAGMALCCIANSFAVAVAAVIILGLGLAFATIGLTVYAEDLSAPEEFSAMVRQLQISYMVGGMLSGPVPGILADWSGSYVLFYVLATLTCIAAMLIVQWNYRKKGVQ